MSFGRWLLVHSFTIFMLTVFLSGYIYRDELQLDTAYKQLLNIDTALEKTSTKTQQEPTEKPAQPTAELNLADDTSSVAVKDKKLSENKAQSLDPIPTLPTVPTVSPSQVDSVPEEGKNDRLFLARQAYWDKKYADSIYFYRQLINENQNNPDYLGELGNIYYALNDNQNASRLYYQAAQIFIMQKQPERARLLIAPITAMNRDLGEKLQIQLR